MMNQELKIVINFYWCSLKSSFRTLTRLSQVKIRTKRRKSSSSKGRAALSQPGCLARGLPEFLPVRWSSCPGCSPRRCTPPPPQFSSPSPSCSGTRSSLGSPSTRARRRTRPSRRCWGRSWPSTSSPTCQAAGWWTGSLASCPLCASSRCTWGAGGAWRGRREWRGKIAVEESCLERILLAAAASEAAAGRRRGRTVRGTKVLRRGEGRGCGLWTSPGEVGSTRRSGSMRMGRMGTGRRWGRVEESGGWGRGSFHTWYRPPSLDCSCSTGWSLSQKQVAAKHSRAPYSLEMCPLLRSAGDWWADRRRTPLYSLAPAANWDLPLTNMCTDSCQLPIANK